jgi:flagellar motor switch protein FliN
MAVGHETSAPHPDVVPVVVRKAPGEAAPSISVEALPSYSRSLLRIRLAVAVTLAKKKQPIRHIVQLGPGAIIHFDKSCDEMLDLEVGGQVVAHGEPVKVGDKFGIRLTSLTLPHERFIPVVRPGGAHKTSSNEQV